MSTSTTRAGVSLAPLRWFLGLGGLLSVLIGIMMVVWPEMTAMVMTTMLAIYAVIGGIFYLGAAFASKGMSTMGRVGLGLAGVLFILTGILAFTNPATSAVTLAVIVVTFLAISWIFEGVAALSTLSIAPSKGWAIFYAIVSILGGIALLMSPLFAGILLWIWAGITLIVIGIVQIIRAFMIGRD